MCLSVYLNALKIKIIWKSVKKVKSVSLKSIELDDTGELSCQILYSKTFIQMVWYYCRNR